jgi:hypothetical protein
MQSMIDRIDQLSVNEGNPKKRSLSELSTAGMQVPSVTMNSGLASKSRCSASINCFNRHLTGQLS